MARRAISVTLESDNVTWLKGRAGAVGESVSEVLDQIVSAARQGVPAGPARSVVGTIDSIPRSVAPKSRRGLPPRSDARLSSGHGPRKWGADRNAEQVTRV